MVAMAMAMASVSAVLDRFLSRARKLLMGKWRRDVHGRRDSGVRVSHVERGSLVAGFNEKTRRRGLGAR